MTDAHHTHDALDYMAVLLAGGFGSIITFANVNSFLGTVSGVLTVMILGNKVRKIIRFRQPPPK